MLAVGALPHHHSSCCRCWHTPHACLRICLSPAHPLAQVPNELLKEWVLLRARVQQGHSTPFAAEGEGQEFYMLRWAVLATLGASAAHCLPPLRACLSACTSAQLIASCPAPPLAPFAPRRSKRTKQHASPPEIASVRKACRNLLSEDEKGARNAAGRPGLPACVAAGRA